MTEYNSRLSRATKAKAQRTTATAHPLKDQFTIYFPTEETVAQSRGGRRVRYNHRPARQRKRTRDGETENPKLAYWRMDAS